MSSKNQTRRTTARNIRFSNHIVEQINITLEHKGSGDFSAWIIETCRRRLAADTTHLCPTNMTSDKK